MSVSHSPPSNKSNKPSVNTNMLGKTRSGSAAIEDFTSQLDQLTNKLSVFEQRFLALEEKIDESNTNLTSHFDSVIVVLENRLQIKLDMLEAVENNIKAKIRELDLLEKTIEAKLDSLNHNQNETGSVNHAIPKELIIRMDNMERHLNSFSLVLRGIPKVKDEDLQNYFVKISRTIGFDKDSEPVTMFRINSRVRNNENIIRSSVLRVPPIIIKFATAELKGAFFNKYLAYKKLCVRDIGFNADTRLYINESLTKRNYNIFKAVYKHKRNGVLSSVFSMNGIVYVKKHNEDKSTPIKFLEDIDKIIAQQRSEDISQQSDRV